MLGIRLPKALGVVSSVALVDPARPVALQIEDKVQAYVNNVYYFPLNAFVDRMIRKVEQEPAIAHRSYRGNLRELVMRSIRAAREQQVLTMERVANTTENHRKIDDFVRLRPNAARNFTELCFELKKE